MSGEELYALFAGFQLNANNCEIDGWNDLDLADQAAWNYLAAATQH